MTFCNKISKKLKSIHITTNAILLPSSIAMILPLLWVIVTSLKDRKDVFSMIPNWIPNPVVFTNYPEALGMAPFGTYLINTIVVTGAILAAQWITITLAAYAFSRFTFRGRDFLFILFILQMMIPPQATVIPNFYTIKNLGLLDTKISLALPFLASGYGTFLLRQTFKSIPQELEDAAKIDGCSGLRFLWHVLIPLSKPTLIAFSMISLISHWNDFFWPLIVTHSPKSQTLTIGLSMFVQSQSGADWTILMAATIFVCFPPLLIFLIFQRRFIRSFMLSGLKG